MTPTPFPGLCIHELVERQAAQKPSAPALLYRSGQAGFEQLSFEQLNKAASRFARDLRGRGIQPGSRVGVSLRSSPELISVLLGILKAGASFVPLDASSPPARLEHILRDARVKLVLLEETLRSHLPADAIQLVSHAEAASPLDEACVLYTSGSTGFPKGVMRTHRAIASRMAWAACSEDGILCHNMPLHTGFSQERLFVPLMSGTPLAVLADESFTNMARLVDDIDALGITEITLVPIALQRILELGSGVRSRLKNLRTVATGGAELPQDLGRAFLAAFPAISLINAYGTTETGSVIRGPVSPGRISIGKPVANVIAQTRDENGEPVTAGEIGELCIEAPSLATGYLNQPELTRERFGPSGARYRTGDRARILPTGEIQLLGRSDRQVKIQGFRVEPGEIEAALEQDETIQEAAVIFRDERLRAYVAAKPARVIDTAAVRKRLSTILLSHMLPHSITILDRLPRGFNGKVDLNALPDPMTVRPALATPYRPARNAIEETIIGIWERVLGITGIGIHDHILELGGDSLSVTRVIVDMKEHLGLDIPVEVLAGGGTVAAVAAHAGL